ncbi:hypothetical protein LTR60_007451, partial [Cryomyces antarcticus]
ARPCIRTRARCARSVAKGQRCLVGCCGRARVPAPAMDRRQRADANQIETQAASHASCSKARCSSHPTIHSISSTSAHEPALPTRAHQPTQPHRRTLTPTAPSQIPPSPPRSSRPLRPHLATTTTHDAHRPFPRHPPGPGPVRAHHPPPGRARRDVGLGAGGRRRAAGGVDAGDESGRLGVQVAAGARDGAGAGAAARVGGGAGGDPERRREGGGDGKREPRLGRQPVRLDGRRRAGRCGQGQFERQRHRVWRAPTDHRAPAATV